MSFITARKIYFYILRLSCLHNNSNHPLEP